MSKKREISWNATPGITVAKEDRVDLNDPPLLDVRNLNVVFGKQQVLRDISLRVPRGQTLAVIGESGCGKTVLLKTLIDLIHPTSGEVLFDGQNLAKLQGRELVQQRIRFGFLFQNSARSTA
jgi:phospholipid/cholesterol/gamma-HCH transport system ATP-binding protein